jgi:hypothetical protein
MDPTETIANTGFEFEPLSSDLPWPISWLDDLANRGAAIHMHASELPHFAAQQEWLCLLDGALHILAEIPGIGWPLADGPLAALHYRLCQHAIAGHLARHPEDWQ